MKTLQNRIAFSLLGLLALVSLPSLHAQVVAPMPDLTLPSVTESGFTAHVTIKNIGTGNAPGCTLRAYYWNGASWQEFRSQYISPLPVGATTVRTITHGNVAAFFNKYVIDATNVVVELRENNNVRYLPEPAG
jgi:hypothetical protein